MEFALANVQNWSAVTVAKFALCQMVSVRHELTSCSAGVPVCVGV